MTYADLRRGVEQTLLAGQRRINEAKVRTYWETGGSLPSAAANRPLTPAPSCASRIAMKSTYSISSAQAQFPAVVRTAQTGRIVGVTKHNETVAFVVSRERMESLVETLELLANPTFVRAWRAEKAGRGKSYPASALAD